MIDLSKLEERVILAAVSTSETDQAESSLDELKELADTAGAKTVGRVIQNRESVHPGTYLGKGKLEELKAADTDIVEKAIAAFSAGATISEVRTARAAKADSIEVRKIYAHRWTERFEKLRFDTQAFKKETGKNVEIFLANMGPIPQHKARADFSTSFLQVGEFSVHLNNGFQDDEDKPGSRWDKCVEALKAGCDDKGTPYDCAVICSTDATYPEDVPALAPRLKEALGKGTLFLAGAAPKDMEAVYREAGIDEFISVKANCYDILRMLQQKKGMKITEEEVK